MRIWHWSLGVVLLIAACATAPTTPSNTEFEKTTLETASNASFRLVKATELGPCKEVFPNGPIQVEGKDILVLCEARGTNVAFASGYSPADNRSMWSAYEYDSEKVEKLRKSSLSRDGYGFVRNPQLIDRGISQPTTNDYTNNPYKYQRGHYAPAETMRYSASSLEASFYVTNIAPQAGGFNGSLWRCVEESIRVWAKDFDKVYVIVGGYQSSVLKPIGKLRKITVPSHYFVVVYRPDTKQALGIEVPNDEDFDLDTRRYYRSVADIEKNGHMRIDLPDAAKARKPNPADWPVLVAQRKYFTRTALDECIPPKGATPIAMLH